MTAHRPNFIHLPLQRVLVPVALPRAVDKARPHFKILGALNATRREAQGVQRGTMHAHHACVLLETERKQTWDSTGGCRPTCDRGCRNSPDPQACGHP